MNVPTLPSPYPGLRPYREDEQSLFFGRETDRDILIDKLLGNRLTLLFAASGVGKSSLLQAAVIPRLKAPTGENLAVVYHIDWVSDPLTAVKASVCTALRTAGLLPEDVEPEGETLAEMLGFCCLFVRAPLVLMLDQFEEFFRYQRHRPGFQPFIQQLATVITDAALPVSVVVSMREDFALELNAFKPQLPTLLFENFYRLEKLDRAAAMRAIVDPAQAASCTVEEDLLQQLLQDLKDRNQAQQGGQGLLEPAEPAGSERVDPPYLQIVCARLWRLKGKEETVLRQAAYQKAGGLDGILRYFLDDALEPLSPREKKWVSRAFDYLAARRGLKMAYPLDVLARIIKAKEAELGAVLNKLARRDMNILRDQTRQGVVWYELYHDMFSDSIERWNTAWKAQQARRQRWTLGVVIALLAALLGVLLDSFLWIYRNNFPADYLFQEQKFRLMDGDLWPEPLPEMVEIPAAAVSFRVGEPDDSIAQTYVDPESVMENFGIPSTTATIEQAFEIGKYEVTYEQYDYYVWQQRRAGIPNNELIYPTGATRDNGRGLRAVTQVSWNEANAYTAWLTEKTGAQYRLPTEAEWEYAARAGTDSPYWWGTEVGVNQANCNGCGSNYDNLLVAPVGQFPANPWGLHDTAGNVWEWTCSEWQKSFDGSEKTCSDSRSGGRVIRGGSWFNTSDGVRSSARLGLITVTRGYNVGFRVLRSSRQDK